MKSIFNHPYSIYVIASIACLSIMIIIDYLLSAEAEHLNAWIIINRLFGNDIGIEDSLAIRKLGLFGSTIAMIFVNSIFGIVLIQTIKLIIKAVHS